MGRYRKIIHNFLTSIFFLVCFFSNHQLFAQNGEALFKANCASCHKVDKDFAGPALKGWKDRVPEGNWIYDWVHNPAAMIAKDPFAKELFSKWKPTVMTAFPALKNEEIDAILKYVDDFAVPTETPGGDTVAGGAKSSDNSILYGVLSLILAIVALVLFQINRKLRDFSDKESGIERSKPIPFFRNKAYMMTLILALFATAGYFLVDFYVGLGRQKNYEPEQPIFYSHEVHAGINQISCLYCHGGAQDSRQAGIPTVNVCMNCHMAVSEYTGKLELKRADGTPVNGTDEIKKLYSYAGWNPDAKAYKPDNDGDGIPDGAKPIEWVKVHNLPDHVYFNHSQHVKVGKQQCQTCHGNIQEMPEVKQFSDLSMGWCINCHRETKVDFFNKETGEGNKFYSIYEKFHNDIKNHKMDSVTVESIGGTECQKCHY